MSRRFLVLLFCLLTWSLPAHAQISPGYWYWQVGDSSPSTQVWESTSGTFVSNTSTNYTAWLTSLAADSPPAGLGLAQPICGAANNGSGLIRLSTCPGNSTGGWLTGQFKTVTGVSGATSANGAWTITVVDQTHIDLQSSTFSGAYTGGGVIGAGSLMDTAANMNAAINRYNVQQYNQGGANYAISTILETQVLSNPISGINVVNMGMGGQIVYMPQANLFGGLPIGQPIVFGANDLSQAWTLKDTNANTIINVPVGFSAIVYLIGNSSVQGGWAYILAPSAAGVSCGGSPTSSFMAESGLVLHC